MTTLGHNGGPPIDNAPVRKRGRPSLYTPELADRICARLAVPESLKPHLLAYCSADLGFVHSVANRAPAAPGIAVGLEAHRIVDAAYRSAAAGGAPQEPKEVQADGLISP